MAVQTKMTAEEFLQLPESHTLTELIDGELIMAPAPELDHQDSVFDSASLIKMLAPTGKVYVAPVDVHFDDGNVVQPDVLWFGTESQCISVNGKYLLGAPDLIIEVLSPSTALRDKQTKFRLYEKHGVREYWIVEPTAQYVEVWMRADEKFTLNGVYGAGDTFTSVVLGQKAVEVSAIFKG